MGFKFGEIVAIIIALVIPLAAFGILLVPGGWEAVYSLALRPDTRPYVFYGGALVVFLILAYRIYRRMRGRSRNASSTSTMDRDR